MSEFTAITSQEQLDAVIGDRLKRSEEKWQKKYEGFMSPDEVNAQISDLQKQLSDANNALDSVNKKSASYEKDLAERDAKIKGYEINSLKHRIAHESGLSYDAVDFIQGNDEESIKASADKFKALVGSKQTPGFSNEPDVSNSKDASIKKLAQNLVPKN
jgi:flagellar biosynthesis chaperone FliJ